MSKWNYITDEEHEDLLAKAPKVGGEAEHDEVVLGIYQVVEGGVCHVDGGISPLPVGNYVKVLDNCKEDWVYLSKGLKVRYSDQVVELKDLTLVALLPENYREVAERHAG